MFGVARPVARASRLCYRFYATGTSTTPPMLLKIRKDMKTAMQNKDSNKLVVLRAILSQTLNASKTSNPISTDMQMLALLHKSVTASRKAVNEFKDAGRQDLVDKEEGQIKIMEEYQSGVEIMGEEEVRSAVKAVVDSMKAEGSTLRMGDVLRKVFSPEVLGEKPVDKGEVSKVVKALLAES